MELQNGKRRPEWRAVAVIGVRVERAGHGSECRERSPVDGGACESVGEAAAVGHAVGVDSGGVDAVVVFEVVDEVVCEKRVLDTGGWVEFSFPRPLAALSSWSVMLDNHFSMQIVILGCGGEHRETLLTAPLRPCGYTAIIFGFIASLEN